MSTNGKKGDNVRIVIETTLNEDYNSETESLILLDAPMATLGYGTICPDTYEHRITVDITPKPYEAGPHVHGSVIIMDRYNDGSSAMALSWDGARWVVPTGATWKDEQIREALDLGGKILHQWSPEASA